MNYQNFNKVVFEHRNSLILIGALIILFAIVGIVTVEVYVRKILNCKSFEIFNFKFSPTLLIIIPIIISLLYFSVRILQCNKDLKNESYVEYVGTVEYSSPSVKFIDSNMTVYVGKGHEIIPKGKHYGKVIYSKESKVIVFFESRTRKTGDGSVS